MDTCIRSGGNRNRSVDCYACPHKAGSLGISTIAEPQPSLIRPGHVQGIRPVHNRSLENPGTGHLYTLPAAHERYRPDARRPSLDICL